MPVPARHAAWLTPRPSLSCMYHIRSTAVPTPPPSLIEPLHLTPLPQVEEVLW